jgi:hypothetical protein
LDVAGIAVAGGKLSQDRLDFRGGAWTDPKVLIVGLGGLVLVAYAFWLALGRADPTWATYLVVGDTILFGALNLARTGTGLLADLQRAPWQVLRFYLLTLAITAVIEVVGQLWLGLWSYPRLTLPEQVLHVWLIGEPVTFFAASQTWILARSLTRSLPLAFVLTAVVNAFGQELPDVVAQETVYHMPVTATLFGVNALVLVGWLGLVAFAAWLTDRLNHDMVKYHPLA